MGQNTKQCMPSLQWYITGIFLLLYLRLLSKVQTWEFKLILLPLTESYNTYRKTSDLFCTECCYSKVFETTTQRTITGFSLKEQTKTMSCSRQLFIKRLKHNILPDTRNSVLSGIQNIGVNKRKFWLLYIYIY